MWKIFEGICRKYGGIRGNMKEFVKTVFNAQQRENKVQWADH